VNEPLLRLSHLSAQVKLGNGELLTTVKDVSFALERGKTYSLVGKSGSGKTSLISIIGLLNRQFSGSYLYEEDAIHSLSDYACSLIRAQHIGFVFQNYSLIKHLKVWENVDLALAYSRKNSPDLSEKNRSATPWTRSA
jgi:putative ABC transport system ATP-binding protein